MSSTVLITIITLSILGLIAAVILYFVAQKFKVYEDPKIDEVEEILPAANCGGCGFAGCRNFAEALVKAESFDGLNCPVGGSETMAKVAKILGKVAPEVEPRVAIVRCNGTPESGPVSLFITELRIVQLPITFTEVSQTAPLVVLDWVNVLKPAILMQCIWIKKPVCR